MKDKFVNNIQINTGYVISAKSLVFYGSVANDIIIGKSADTCQFERTDVCKCLCRLWSAEDRPDQKHVQISAQIAA